MAPNERAYTILQKKIISRRFFAKSECLHVNYADTVPAYDFMDTRCHRSQRLRRQGWYICFYFEKKITMKKTKC